MRRNKPEVLQGTLDLLILQTLAIEPLHGWGIAKSIRERSEDVLSINQGSLYPALYRLVDRGMLSSKLSESALGRPAKVYSLTAKGRKALKSEASSWRAMSRAVDLILQEG